MSRKQEIDSFLRRFATIYASNPNFQITCDSFYGELMQYGLSQEDIANPSIRDNFDSWIKRYYNSRHLNVHFSKLQERFLQFPSKEHAYSGEFKLYLSFPKDKIEACVNEVFDFIERNKIDSGSKVADMVRSDSVVLRLTNSVDVAKVIDFVNNNKFLRKNALPTNPFLMRYGVVGYAYDDRISYNTVVTMILEKYFKFKRENADLINVSYQDFFDFSMSYYNELFNDPKELDEFTRHRAFKHSNHQDLGYAINNYRQVISLMCSSLMGDLTFNQYTEYVEECRDKNNNREYAAYYNEFIKSAYPFEKQNVMKDPNDIVEERNLVAGKELLDEYITYAIEKYGKEGVTPYLQHFMRGYVEGITKDRGFRVRFNQILDGPTISKIVKGDIASYIATFHTNKEYIESFDLVYNACVETFKKYGFAQLHGAIKKGTYGNYSSFTNGEGRYRDRLCTNVSSEEFIRICEEIAKRHGYNIQASQDGFMRCADAIASQLGYSNNQGGFRL